LIILSSLVVAQAVVVSVAAAVLVDFVQP